MSHTPSSSLPAFPEVQTLSARMQEELRTVQEFLSPTTIADIQERLWEHTARLEELFEKQLPPPSPVVAQPRRLPRALNPLFFIRKPRQGNPELPEDL